VLIKCAVRQIKLHQDSRHSHAYVAHDASGYDGRTALKPPSGAGRRAVVGAYIYGAVGAAAPATTSAPASNREKRRRQDRPTKVLHIRLTILTDWSLARFCRLHLSGSRAAGARRG